MARVAHIWLALFAAGGCTAIFDTDSLDFGRAEIDWVEIPGGAFQMGDPGADEWSYEYPVHEVEVEAFEIARTETTVAQYAACVRAIACTPPADNPDSTLDDAEIGPLPVRSVTWSQAAEFCEWAGGRLPSEAEWEYAARGAGDDVTYPWGEEEPSCDLAIMENGCGTGLPWPVCSRPEGNTDQGLCDMAGNVAEWVQDLWHYDYEGAPADGTAWETGGEGDEDHVFRGGDYWSSDPEPLTVYARHPWVWDEETTGAHGFRCAR
jgi:formylglycine-generating enzyme required for sulfatase activity